MVSYKVNLPTEEDLAVQEINLSISALRAGSFHLGKYCENDNNEYMLCKHELQDPRKCLNEGKAVTNCALSFFQNVKKLCHDEFTQYSKCLYQSSGDMLFSRCRNTQSVYDKCVLDNMGIDRPEYGHFCRVKVHDTNRPKPENKPTVYSDVPDKLPDDYSKPPANLGSRNII